MTEEQSWWQKLVARFDFRVGTMVAERIAKIHEQHRPPEEVSGEGLIGFIKQREAELAALKELAMRRDLLIRYEGSWRMPVRMVMMMALLFGVGFLATMGPIPRTSGSFLLDIPLLYLNYVLIFAAPVLLWQSLTAATMLLVLPRLIHHKAYFDGVLDLDNTRLPMKLAVVFNIGALLTTPLWWPFAYLGRAAAPTFLFVMNWGTGVSRVNRQVEAAKRATATTGT